MKKNHLSMAVLLCCMVFLISAAGTNCAEAEKLGDRPRQVQVIVSGIDATSYIQGKDPNAYVPARMMDGREETCWQFSTKVSELKETFIYLSFEKGARVDQIWIKNGFWKVTDGLDQYTRNSRVKKTEIAFKYQGKSGYTDKQTVTLKDDEERRDWQKINLGRHDDVVGIRLRINSIYKGTKYKTDVCISEMMVVAEMPAITDTSLYCPLGSGTVNFGNTSADALYALATSKLATRSGPGTEYTEEGTYQVAGQMIRILAKAYDINNVCWVQCRIPYQNRYVTAWTGWKRFDHSTLDIALVSLSYQSSHAADEMTASEEDVPMYGFSESEADELTWPGGGLLTGSTDDETDDMLAVSGDANPALGDPGSAVAEYYSSTNPKGTMKILYRSGNEFRFEFSIERIAVFENLYAEVDSAGKGTFISRGDWDISGTIAIYDRVILLYLNDTPNLSFDMSAREFIGSDVLIFYREDRSSQ